MVGIRKIAGKIAGILDVSCLAASSVFFSLMLLLVIFQVAARYFFRGVPVWTEEAARYCMVWGGLLGAAVAFHRNRDPKLIHPPKIGPPLWIVTAAILRAAAVVIFLFPVLRHSGRFLTRTAHRTTEALGISTVWVTVSVPVTVVLIFLFLLLRPAVGIVGLSGENGRAEAGAGGENGDVKGTQSAGEPR